MLRSRAVILPFLDLNKLVVLIRNSCWMFLNPQLHVDPETLEVSITKKVNHEPENAG